VGSAAAKAIGTYGAVAAGGTLLLAAAGFLIVRRLERRITHEDQVPGE
jgi:positive regulator of sigma E activity